MMNLSRISLTKYLGCLFTHSREAVSRLEAKGHGRTHTPPDLDPFAFFQSQPAIIALRHGRVPQKRPKSGELGGNATIPAL
jgi:hypothetical protein